MEHSPSREVAIYAARANWNVMAKRISLFIWEYGYIQARSGEIGVDELLDIYLDRLENLVTTSCRIE
jgi:hypothetical protein